MTIRYYLEQRQNKTNPFIVVASIGIFLAGLGIIINSISAKVTFKSSTSAQLEKQSTSPSPPHPPQANTATAERKAHPPAEPQSKFQSLNLTVRGSLPHSFYRAVGKEKGKFLAAVTARLLMWKMDLRKDLRRGDKLALLYKPVDNPSKYEIQALSYYSKKYSKTFYFFRFQSSDEEFPSYYDDEGNRIELILKNSPIRRYQQITSFPKMRPKHKGIDFKAPVGSKIYLPYRARVIRTNWNTRYNGLCIEVEYFRKYRGKRVRGIFLHLEKIMPYVKPRKILKAGTLIALSGNTGRSTAPHLHYQVQTRRKKVIFPLDYHGTIQKTLTGDDYDKFAEVVKQLKPLIKIDNQE